MNRGSDFHQSKIENWIAGSSPIGTNFKKVLKKLPNIYNLSEKSVTIKAKWQNASPITATLECCYFFRLFATYKESVEAAPDVKLLNMAAYTGKPGLNL